MNKADDNAHSTETGLTLHWFLARCAGVILNPRGTLQKVLYEKGAWIPIVIVSIALVGVRLTDLPATMAQYSDPEYINSYVQQSGLDSTAAASEIDKIKVNLPVAMLVGSPVLVLANIAIVTLIIYIVGMIFFHSKVRFSPVFNMVSWATLINFIQLALTIPYKLLDLGDNLPTNLAALFPADSISTYFRSIFQLIDLFMIWEVYLLSIGLTAIYRIKMQLAVSTIGTMFVFIIVLNAVVVSISGIL